MSLQHQSCSKKTRQEWMFSNGSVLNINSQHSKQAKFIVMSLVIVSKNCSKMSMSTKYKATSKLKINTGKLLSIAYQMQINVLKKCKWSKKRNNLEKRISSPSSSTLMRILITHQNRFHNELYLQKMCNLCELLPMRNKILDL